MSAFRSRLLGALAAALLANALPDAARAVEASAEAVVVRPPAAAPDIAELEAHVNGVATLTARFAQLDDSGRVLGGSLWLGRPGRLRLEYDDAPDLIVSDGTILTHWDKKLEQRSDMFLSSSIFSALLDAPFRLEGGDARVEAAGATATHDWVRLAKADDPGAGRLTLYFSRAPRALSGWELLDASGGRVVVRLEDVRLGAPISRETFVAPTPPIRRD